MPSIPLRIPEGTDWPVIGRDSTTGDLILRRGFIEAVAEASGCASGPDGSGRPLLTEDMLGTLLLEWYGERRRMGAPPCPIMEALIKEAARDAMH